MAEKIVIATTNKGKIREMKKIFENWGVQVVDRNEAGVPESLEIVEDGATFEENALKKAREIGKITGKIAISDDSGLTVDYLGDFPGVHSARFAGDECDDEKNINKLLKLMENVPKVNRKAHFETVIAMVFPNGEEIISRGKCFGEIAKAPIGEEGFGYDPVFVPEGYNNTFAQLGTEVKNKISHRAKALSDLERILNERKNKL